MQIEIAIWYHYTLIRRPEIKNHNNVGKAVVKLGPSHFAGGIVTWDNHSGKQVGKVLRKAKHATINITWSSHCTPGHLSWRSESLCSHTHTHTHKYLYTKFTAALFLIPQNWNNPDAFQCVRGELWNIHTMKFCA